MKSFQSVLTGYIRYKALVGVCIVCAANGHARADTIGAQDVFESTRYTSAHFVIQYSRQVPQEYAVTLARTAEKLYERITGEFNLIREKAWLCENRVTIFIAANAQEYLNVFQCPAWSAACVEYEKRLLYTYYNQAQFFVILAHELTHIIFREYVGSHALPLWVDEGMALYIEDKYTDNSRRSMMGMFEQALAQGRHIPLAELAGLTPASLRGKPAGYVSLFYAEAFSLINFMVQRYDKNGLNYFLYHLRNGSGVEGSLAKAFASAYTMADFEKQWLAAYRK